METLAHRHRTDPAQLVRCGACGNRFAWANLLVNTCLTAVKATVGFLAGSHALIASALYSFNDVLSAAAVLVSLRIADRQPNKKHPFGYGKVEFLAVGAVSLVLAASVCFFVYETVALFTSAAEGPPSGIAAVVALGSLAASEMLARRGFCVASHLGSPALHTSAEHNRADAISSGAVVIGVVGSMMGLHFLDRLVAMYEALDVAKLGGELLARSLKGLMDAALPPDHVAKVKQACLRVPGVLHLDTLRSRRSGAQVWVDLVVVIAEDQTVYQAHELRKQLRETVVKTLGHRTLIQVAFRTRSVSEATPETAEVHA